MRDFIVLLVHLVATLIRLAKPGGLRSVVAESVLLRHQLLILNRGRKRAPSLSSADRTIVGWCMLFIRRARVFRSAIVLKPSTLLHLHKLLTKRKYRLLFSPKRRRLSPNRSADRVGLRGGNRQGRSSPYPERSLPARIECRRSLLAQLSRPYEGQPVELRFVPMRLSNLEYALGSGGDGSVFPAHRWLWRPRWPN